MSLNLFSQEEIDFDTVEFNCSGHRTISAIVPEGYQISKFSYYEGIYRYLEYKDSSRITIHCGSMIKIPILDNKNLKVLEKTKNSRRGIDKQNGNHWREDNLDGFNVYYQNVKGEHVKVFDYTLDSIKINTSSTE